MSDHEIQGRKTGSGPPRLFDLAREAIRRHHYSYRTEETYLQWMKRFILFSGKRHGDVELPDALARKSPHAPYEWAWKFVFPSHKRSVDPRTGVIRRHHVYENYLIRGVKSPLDRAGQRVVGYHAGSRE